MIITNIFDGLGNQLFKYAVGRRLSIEKGVLLKLDITTYEKNNARKYLLDKFNIVADIASKEEINSFKPLLEKSGFRKIFSIKGLRKFVFFYERFYFDLSPIKEKKYLINCDYCYSNDFLKVKNDAYISGSWESELFFKPIEKIINLDCTNKIIAHSDAYPTYEWKLKIQFDDKQFPELYKELISNYDMEIDYFQSGILLYDTNIIDDNTKKDILDLSNKYINSRTNEQGIMNLYFNCIKKIWQPVRIKDNDTYYYDYWERDNLKYTNYIMLKYPKTIR